MLCLHASLKAQGEPFRLQVLCFDAETEAVVRAEAEESLLAIPLVKFLVAEPDFAAVRASRSRVEFYFTATPVLIRHCFAREAEAERMTYLDADLFFFRPASEVFKEQGDASVGIVPHRFPRETPELLAHGIYNVGWVSFHRDADGLACLEWWRERCLEWCHDYADAGRYADQGYLNEFPRRFAGVVSLHHPGVNAAPWNVEPPKLALREGGHWMQGRPIVFYHYQGVREIAPGWFDPGLRSYGVKLTRGLRDWVYLPYLSALAATQGRLRARHGLRPSLGYKRLQAGSDWRTRRARFVIQWVMPLWRLVRGQLIYCPEPGRHAV